MPTPSCPNPSLVRCPKGVSARARVFSTTSGIKYVQAGMKRWAQFLEQSVRYIARCRVIGEIYAGDTSGGSQEKASSWVA